MLEYYSLEKKIIINYAEYEKPNDQWKSLVENKIGEM